MAIEGAYKAGGFRVVLDWRCKNSDLGVPEHRRRVVMILAHKSQARIPEEVVAYQAALAGIARDEELDASITLEDVFLSHGPALGPADLTFENCMVSAADIAASKQLTLVEVRKVAACKAEIKLRVGDRESWFTGDMKHGGGEGQFPNLHKTEGRTPTITASHCHHALYCFNQAHEGFFLVPELMIARGFGAVPIRVACEYFHGLPNGWSQLGKLVGGAVTPPAYRVAFRVLMEMAPNIMKPRLLSPVVDMTFRSAFSDEELASCSMHIRFQGKFLVYPGTEAYLKRDFVNPDFQCIGTADWAHIHTVEFGSAHTRLHLPGGVLHVIKHALQSQGVDTHEALRHAHSSPAYVKTDMIKKRGNNLGGVGFIAQPGVRNRIWDADTNAAGNKIGQCHFKGQVTGQAADEEARRGQELRAQQYLSYLHNVQHVCNATDAAIACHMGEAACRRLESMVGSKLERTASRTYPSVQIGLNPGITMHLDKGDSCEATWQLVGEKCAMGLPQCRTILHFQDGDAIVFDASKIWHGMVRVPPSICLNACYSMYFNKSLA